MLGKLSRDVRARGLLFASFLVVQVGVPLALLPTERPARFGWQMYAGIRTQPRFWARDRGGVTSIEVWRLLGNPRVDVQIPTASWPQLCALSSAASIRVEWRGHVSEQRCP
jgi:hypothetical protein